MERGGERWEIVSLQVDLELLIRGQDRLGVRDYLGRRLVAFLLESPVQLADSQVPYGQKIETVEKTVNCPFSA
jgi:hypothetical protein